ncbi:MAG: SGNH/GDSL hydrolase family protein [Hyphomicrobiales bacterium]|nr:SGNH/GDSL hydrolase family protein [Hyphomicrobiales bacterium]
MAVIVAFGDSNTWGSIPDGSGGRHPPDVRWPGALARALGPGHRVIEEGLGGRTAVLDDPYEPHRRGLDYLAPCLMSHRPLDLLIVALGCNDMKARFGQGPSDIALGVERLLVAAKSLGAGPGGGAPKSMLICPPPLARLTGFADMFAGATEKSRALAPYYRAAAERHGALFLDAGAHVRCSDGDGIHWEASEHLKLGAVVAAAIAPHLP